jgi:multiple sugar transport system substrate-binding protein
MGARASGFRWGWLVGLAVAAGCGALVGSPEIAGAADSPYAGTSVRFLTSRNTHQLALADKLGELAKQMGIDLQVRFVTTDQLEKKVVIDYVGGADTWDLVYTGGIQRMHEWAEGGIIQDIAPLIAKFGDQKALALDDFTPAARHAVTQGDKMLGLTVATSEQALAYRKDLFDNPDEKAAFKARYGYDLAAPDTYKQFYDVAQFFTRKKGEKLAGKTLDADFYGTILSNKRGTFLWHKYENVVAAFGVDIYDPTTGRVGVMSPESIAAANYYKSLLPFLPAGHINMSSGESTTLFTNGQVAMMVEYVDRVASSLAKSAIRPEMVGYAFAPTAEGNPKGRQHAARSGPAVVAVFGRSTNPEAAYKLLEAATTAEQQFAMARKHAGYMPSRVSALKELGADDPASAYLVRMSTAKVDALTDADLLPYPTILKAAQIEDIFGDAISQILLGAPVEQELQKAQIQVEDIVKTLKK